MTDAQLMRISVKRDLLQCQKRPNTVAKETYTYLYILADDGRSAHAHHGEFKVQRKEV